MKTVKRPAVRKQTCHGVWSSDSSDPDRDTATGTRSSLICRFVCTSTPLSGTASTPLSERPLPERSRRATWPAVTPRPWEDLSWNGVPALPALAAGLYYPPVWLPDFLSALPLRAALLPFQDRHALGAADDRLAAHLGEPPQHAVENEVVERGDRIPVK